MLEHNHPLRNGYEGPVLFKCRIFMTIMSIGLLIDMWFVAAARSSNLRWNEHVCGLWRSRVLDYWPVISLSSAQTEVIIWNVFLICTEFLHFRCHAGWHQVAVPMNNGRWAERAWHLSCPAYLKSQVNAPLLEGHQDSTNVYFKHTDIMYIV